MVSGAAFAPAADSTLNYPIKPFFIFPWRALQLCALCVILLEKKRLRRRRVVFSSALCIILRVDDGV